MAHTPQGAETEASAVPAGAVPAGAVPPEADEVPPEADEIPPEAPTAPAEGPGSHGDLLSRGLEPVTWIDWTVLALVGLNLLILTGGTAYAAFVPGVIRPYLVWADLAIVAILAVELVVKLSRAERKKQYLVTHWYDVLGLVPIASAGLRAVRLVRILRIYVMYRTDWQGEKTWISAFVRSVILRYLDILLSVITKPLMLAMIKVVELPLRKARFAAVAGTVLDQQRKGIESVTLATLRLNKATKQVADLGLTKKAVHVISDAVLDQVVDVLKSDELNDLMADAVGDVLRAATEGITGSAKAASEGMADASVAA